MKNLKYLIVFCLMIILSANAFAVDLIVGGSHATYADMNGTYKPCSNVNGYSAWKHATLSYYIWYNPEFNTWIIDNNTTYDGSTDLILFNDQDWNGGASPTAVVNWADQDNNKQDITVSEVSLNPEIDIRGNSTSIVSGDASPSFADYTKFGSALSSGGTTTRTFTIQNTGAAALTLGAISFTGTNATEFTGPSSLTSPVAASGSTSFTVTFTPTGTGSRNATISIGNNDANENPYTFAINGYGYSTKTLVVSGITTPSAANGNYIHQGVLNNFEYWKHATENYYIYNYADGSGIRSWNIDGNQIGNDGTFFYKAFSEDVTPTGLTFNASNGTGIPVISETTPVPEINVVGNNSQSISSGDNTPRFYDGTNFGTLDYASGTRTRTFTIQNTGTAALTISGTTPYVTITGADASEFSVTTPPSSSVAASGSTTFIVTFNPSSVGTKTATITIGNNDSDEGIYTYFIQGDGITTKNLVVSNLTTPSAANGTYTYQGLSNEFPYWKHSSSNYYLYNSLSKVITDQHFWYIDNNTDPVAYNFNSDNNGENASPVNVTSWSVSNGNAGTPTIQYAEPEINITGNTLTIGDGDATPSIYDYSDLGWTTSGSITRTYTIQNLGTETLTLTGTSPYVIKGGTDASQFSITTPPAATIVAGGSTTFQVTFTPTASIGVRTATLSIANTDADENPYNFSIQAGLGISPVVTTQAVGSISSTTATGNGNVTTLGSPNPTAYGVCWNTSGTPTTADSKIDNGMKSSAGVFTAAMTSLNPNTTYHVRAFVTNNVGTTYGSEVTFTTSPVAPTVTTQAVSSITATTATGNGNITSLGAPNPTAYGVCWNTSGTPTASDSKTNLGAASTTGAFTASMTGLSANTTYHVRSYATNTAGTSYGTEVSFTTSPLAPTVTTQAVSGIATTTATGNGNVTSLGAPNPTAYGVCWNTTGTPTTSDSKMDKGAASTTGAFTASITGLNASTQYFVRSYATNTLGTSYGEVVSFTTSPSASAVTTQDVSSIGSTTATGNGNITNLGIPSPTAYGVCWSTTETPTTSDSKTDNGVATVTGAFTASMTGLSANTTYHVRSYATNIAGTSYGTEVSFTTSPVAPTVTTQAVSGIATTTATGNGSIANLGAPNPTAYGVCWNTTGTPTTSDSKTDNGAATATATGTFTASMTGLSANTIYYVRSFATNIAGTSYGSDVSFKTNAISQTITFNTLDVKTYGDASFDLSASSNSGLDVSYVSSVLEVATVSGKTVTIVGAGNTTITASQLGNASYAAATDASQVFHVDPKVLTISGLSGVNKEYDGTNVAILSGTASLNGVVTGDANNMSLSGSAAATFANKNAGDTKTITFAGYSLSGSRKDQYTLTQPTGITANITTRPIAVSGVSASNKVYDGTTVATLSGGTIDTVSGDIVTLNIGTGVFANKNVGTAMVVTASGYSISGPDAGNYTLTTQPTGITASITPYPITVTADAKSIQQGDDDVALTYSVDDLLGSDVITGALTRDVGDTAGTYAILQGTLSAGSNYIITFNGADFVITDKPVFLDPVVPQLAFTGRANARIFNLQGVQVWSGVLDVNEGRVAMPNLGMGRWVVKLQLGNAHYTAIPML